MEGKRGWGILAGLLGLFLAQLACGVPVNPVIDRFDCETKGGTWHNEIKPGEKNYSRWCETATVKPPPSLPVEEDAPAPAGETPVPTTTQDDAGRGECIAPRNSYTWSYEGLQSSSGTGGVTCSARFVVTNTGSEPLLLVLYTALDNNKLRNERWDTYSLQPGELKEERVNRTNYTDGVVTFSRVDSILVVRDVPECARILTDDSQAVWKAQSIPIEAISCP